MGRVIETGSCFTNGIVFCKFLISGLFGKNYRALINCGIRGIMDGVGSRGVG